MKSRLLGAVCVGIIVFGVNASGNAADYGFTKIIDSNDTIPGRADSFTRFGSPSLDGRDIAFAGDRNSGYSGVFTYIGGKFSLVADSTTPIPAGIGNFDTLELPIISQGNVAFVATEDSGFEASGIYTDVGGSLRVVADHNTPIPGGTGNFGFLTDESHDFDKGVVAFKGWESFQPQLGGPQGIYTDINGDLDVVVDLNTTIPDATDNFTGFSINGMDGADVAFLAGDASGFARTYLSSDGTISILFSEGASRVDVAAGTLIGSDASSLPGENILTNVGGTLHIVAATGDLTPDGIGNFTKFDDRSVEGDELAFMAVEDTGDFNIYRYFDGELHEVISIGDMLDGKSVTHLMMSFSGIDIGAIAFAARFEDGSSGIYLAEVVPVPPAVWLFASGLLGLAGIARRKKAA